MVWSQGGDSSGFVATAATEETPRLSPNDRWLAYVSDHEGEPRVYAQPFPDGGAVIPMSIGPGTEPVWSTDGRELFFRDNGRMMVVEVDAAADDLNPRQPQMLFAGYPMNPWGSGEAAYDVAPDGRFLMFLEDSGTDELVWVQNFAEELNRLLPVD